MTQTQVVTLGFDEIKVGDWVRYPGWGSINGSYHQVALKSSLRIRLLVKDKIHPWDYTKNHNPTWWKMVTEVDYVPTQEGDRDDDI